MQIVQEKKVNISKSKSCKEYKPQNRANMENTGSHTAHPEVKRNRPQTTYSKVKTNRSKSTRSKTKSNCTRDNSPPRQLAPKQWQIAPTIIRSNVKTTRPQDNSLQSQDNSPSCSKSPFLFVLYPYLMIYSL